jgi:hypothetical protein
VKLLSVQALFRALNESGVRFLVAGGLAVNAHGYLRFTKDADLVLHFGADNIRRAFAALAALGYHPIVPVTASQFADEAVRTSWVRDKGMQVLQFFSDAHPETPVDVFAAEPFPFDGECAQAMVKELEGSGPVRFVSLATLIRMKEMVGRPEDRLDVANLRMRQEDRDG